MKHTYSKRLACAALAALMLLTGCGRRSSNVDEGSNGGDKGAASAAVVRPASNLELRNDPVIQDHLENNHNLSTARNTREATNFHFYIENTETMKGFTATSVRTNFKEGVQSLLDVARNTFTNLDAHSLEYSSEEKALLWQESELNDRFIRKVQTKSFYDNPLVEITALEELMWEDAIMDEYGVTAIVSNFVEPGNDVNALAVAIEAYFDAYENSAACVMGMTSLFEGDFHVPYDGGNSLTYRITSFKSDVPFYIVLFGPEQSVRDLTQRLDEAMRNKHVEPTYDIYTNNANAQVLAEPLSFDLLGDLKRKKAPAEVTRSYNTGDLYEDDGGNVYYAASSGRAETLDSEENGDISSSTQISVISKDYDGHSSYHTEYTLYTYDAVNMTWVEAGKNALARTTVTVQPLSGPAEDELSEEPILTAGRREMLIKAKLDFGSGSALRREEIYRVEVKLYLNRANTEAGSNGNGPKLADYSVVRAEYDTEINKLSDGWQDTKIWTSEPESHPKLLKVLTKTPNLGDLLLSLEQLQNKYQDDTQLIEYVDFVFNVPSEETK